ncbi:uncharacterized protein DUF4491 [Anaerobacterium chartisolvens]|uniref:Uncharacterized protein DUF4491 n=1 Tax=Anaerobacterium chartisolvens TaxID=1297424 RepID=A0A369BD10_9FIRM|nr:DUF4491 family protein [Anaerobacterium chartisolvens]RCX19450.1 uncharacterized protein DUF4491 [Anaerobacterium chartisolvens]
MNFSGIIIGVIAFLCIGIFHPIVIKCQYHFTDKVWPVFLVCGILCLAASLIVGHDIVSAGLAVIGFSSLWSIGELKEQKRRTERGWFPKNPKHHL